MLDNVNNEAIFAKLFEQLLNKQNNYPLPTQHSRKGNNGAMNKESCRGKHPNHRRGKIKKSKKTNVHKTETTQIMLFSETCADITVPTNETLSNNSQHHKQVKNNTDTCDKKQTNLCMNDGINAQCNINVPDNDVDGL